MVLSIVLWLTCLTSGTRRRRHEDYVEQIDTNAVTIPSIPMSGTYSLGLETSIAGLFGSPAASIYVHQARTSAGTNIFYIIE